MKSMRKNYELALEVLEALNSGKLTETKDREETRPELAAAPLAEILSGFTPLPDAALFLGVAYDHLPILLNLNDPTPGPILIAGDPESGKRAFLQMIAHAASQTHAKDNLQFGVVTRNPETWQAVEAYEHCMGIFPTYGHQTNDFILSLADWAHHNREEKRFALLLIDDFENITRMDENVQQHVRWLLLRGPNRRVWTFSTLNARYSRQVSPWLDAFRTRLLGSVKSLRDAESISHTRDAELHLLEPRIDFLLYENRQWIKFWIPSI